MPVRAHQSTDDQGNVQAVPTDVPVEPAAPETAPEAAAAADTADAAVPLIHEGVAPDASPLTTVFYALCVALHDALEAEDNLPAALHADDIQGWMTDAGTDVAGHAQQITAWRHAVGLLEQVLGERLTAG